MLPLDPHRQNSDRQGPRSEPGESGIRETGAGRGSAQSAAPVPHNE